MLRLRALYLLIILVFLLPSLTLPVLGGHGNVRTEYSPSFSMPLPTPAGGPIVQAAPVSGVLRVLVIGAYFADVNYTVSISQLKQEFFTGMENYYGEISYGKVTIEGDAYGWYKLPYDQAHYGKNCLSINDADCSGQDNSWEIAQDAAPLAEKDVNFANYNYFVFIHSGDGQESSGVTDEVWSVTYLGGVAVETTTKTLDQFSIVSELQAGGAVPLGVWCHEFAHLLDIPDLFNTNTGQPILGPWSIMDKGTWNGNPPGSSPAHLIAWGKIQLGFISGSMLATANPGVTSTFTIDPTEVASSNVHVVEVPLGQQNSDPTEYYLIEVRAPIGFDSALPNFGVLISLVNNNAVVGPIHIIDGHPSVPELNDAVWNVGQTFTDTANGFSVAITGKTGNSYQVTVNRGAAPPPQQPQNQTYIYLAITGISAQPPTITLPNTTVTVTVQITNSGTEAADNVPIEVTLDGLLYTNLEISVSAGATAPLTFTWIAAVGSHMFKVVIDPNATINNTNRVNNSATFTLNVGPSLTINVPLNITSSGSVWILINGAKYNITSSQFQTSVPSGTITVEIQPGVNVSQGVRQGFAGWSDGNTSNPRQLTVTSATVLQAVYKVQYLLTVDSNGGTTTPSAWYSPNSTVTVTADNPSNVTANSSRYIFASWSGDQSSNSTGITVTMTKPLTLQANWIRQYYLTIISPTGSPSGAGWYNAGTIVTVGVQSTVQYPNGTRLVFEGWNSSVLGNNPTTQVAINSPIRLLAVWTTQYLVTVNSEYGTAVGGGWYNIGSSAQASVPSEIAYTNGTKRVFAEWTGDYSGQANTANLQVYGPKTLNAEWNTQYLITLTVTGLPNSTILKLNLNNVTYDLPADSSYETWVQDGAEINPSLNNTITSGIMAYKFTGWRNSTGGITQDPLIAKSPATYTASYTPQLSLPPIPGFPIEAIILGLLLGLIASVIRRRYQRPSRHRINRITRT